MGGGVSGEGAAVVAEARRAADIAIRRKWCLFGPCTVAL